MSFKKWVFLLIYVCFPIEKFYFILDIHNFQYGIHTFSKKCSFVIEIALSILKIGFIELKVVFYEYKIALA